MNQTPRILHAVAVALLGAALPASAQSDTPRIRPGERVAAALSDRDLTTPGRGHFRVYRFDAEPGRAYVLRLRSTAFDAYLLVVRTVGPLSDSIASDDDSGGGTDSRLRFRPSAPGPYLAVVSALQGDSALPTGTFELELREAVEHAAIPRPIAAGDSVAGELGEQSAMQPESGAPFDVYTFHARQGQSLHVTLRSATTPPAILHFGRWSEGRFQPLSMGRLSRMPDPDAIRGDGRTTPLPIREEGEYALRVKAIDGGAPEVAYTLRLTETPASAAVLRRAPVAAGAEVPDSLTANDALDDERPYREWTYSAAARQRVTVTMRSRSFDPYLELGYYERNDSFHVVAANDDWEGNGTDSRITFTPPEARDYVIRAKSFSPATGPYTLRIDTPRPHVPQVGRVRAGSEVQGTLDDSDATLELDGSPYDDWLYHATAANERVVVTVTSPNFDTFVMLGQKRNGSFEEFTSNDDAQLATHPAARTDSRLVAVLPEPGDYVIRVNTFGPDGTGAYRLKVERAP